MQFKAVSRVRNVAPVLSVLFLVANSALSQGSSSSQQISVDLQVEPGTPLRVYITKRLPYKVGATIQAKVIEPVWAFDRIVIPSGTTLQGQVVKLDPVAKMVRAHAILGGDFTPLKQAQVSFTTLRLPDGRELPLHTAETLGLPTIYLPPRPAKNPTKQKVSSPTKQKPGSPNPSPVRQFLRQQLMNQAHSQASARSRGIYDLVRGPNKREWIENYLCSKLPWHPQWYRARTRFDAVLTEPLDFGTVQINSSELANSDTVPPRDSIAQMRLLTPISSAYSGVGDRMEGILSQPLFTNQQKLLLPEGTRFSGRITLAQHARLFHRGGKLRFTIDNVIVPQSATAGDEMKAGRQRAEAVQGQLIDVEANPEAIKVDSEGTAAATESKIRLLRPVVAGLIAAKSLDNDTGKQTASGTGAPNAGGRSLAGFSGFGLLGTIASRGPRAIGVSLGFYGLAWSVYSNVMARGSEVVFPKNTAIAIQFGPQAQK